MNDETRDRIADELGQVARLAVGRISASPFTDCIDTHLIRSAVYAVFIYDRPDIEGILGEIERLAREELQRMTN